MGSPTLARRGRLLLAAALLLSLLGLVPRMAGELASPALASGSPALGILPWYPAWGATLSDRMDLSVNLGNGNPVLHSSDLAIKGGGLDLAIDRCYNNLATTTGSVARGWTLGVGQDVNLKVLPGISATFTGPGGDQFVFSLNGDGSYASPPGADATLVKNGDGTFTLKFQATGMYDTFTSAGVLTASHDQNGNLIQFLTYPALRNQPVNGISQIYDNEDRYTKVTSYSNLGRIAGFADPTGRTLGYLADNIPNLTTFTDAAGKQTLYGYDHLRRNLVQITDPNNQVTALGYDSSNRVTSIALGSGSSVAGTYTFTYNSGNTVVTDPTNHQATYSYDGQGRLTGITDALGNSQGWSWTADNHVQQYTDAKGKVTNYSYDGNNNLTHVQLPPVSLSAGPTMSWQYQDSNHPYYPTGVTDPQGNTTTYHYTPAGNPDVITDALPSQNQTQLSYTLRGEVYQVVDARGNTTTYDYDLFGNLTTITPPSPMGGITIARASATSITLTLTYSPANGSLAKGIALEA